MSEGRRGRVGTRAAEADRCSWFNGEVEVSGGCIVCWRMDGSDANSKKLGKNHPSRQK